ncbi:preprotein translocase subunit SecE [Desulfolithobacter sp.]
MASKKKGRSNKSRQVVQAESAETKKTSLSPAAVKEFILEVQAEFKKVVWPDKKVTIGLTGFVIILVIVISLYLGSVDLLLGKLVSMVLR